MKTLLIPLFLLFARPAESATVTYTMQTGNFNSLQTEKNNNPPYAGTYNNGATELANYANGGSFGNTPGAAAFQTFTTTGNGGSGTARALQVGDTFTITAYTGANPSAGGRVGISFRDSTTYTNFFSSTDASTEARFQLDNTGNWKVYGNSTVESGSGSAADRTFVIKITSDTTFDAQVGGTWYYNNTMAASGGTIDSFAIYTYGDSNSNSFWKSASLADTGTVELGYALGGSSTFTPGVVSNGLAANSTTTSVANAVYIGGDSGSAVILDKTNTYTGATTINTNATACAQNPNAFGTTVGGVTVQSGARIQISGNTTIGSEALTLNGDGISYSGSLQSTSGTNAWQGDISNNSGARINADAGLLTLSGNITNAASQPLYIGGGGSITISGTISGNNAAFNGALYKDGSGTLTLTGNNTASLTGLMRIQGGTLSVADNNNLTSGTLRLGSGGTSATILLSENTTRSQAMEVTDASTAGVVNVASGKTFTLSGVLGQTGSNSTTKIGKAGAGTWSLGGNNTYAGQIQIGEGDLILANNTAHGTNNSTANRGVDLGLNVGDTSMGNNVGVYVLNGVTSNASIYVADNTSSATRTIGLSGSGSGGFSNEIRLDGNTTLTGGTGTATFSGNITQNSNARGLIISGGTVALSGSNTFTGGVTLNSGQLNINSATALGTSAGTFTINGGTIDNTSSGAITLSNNNPQSWAGNFTFAGTKDLNMGSGTITLTANRTITVSSGNLTLPATTISGSYWITKDGAGTLNFGDVARTWATGGIIVNSGTLVITAGNNFGTNPSANQLVFSGNSTLRIGANGNGSNTALGRTMSINSGVTAAIDTGLVNIYTFANVITGSGAINKIGTGTAVFTAANNYSGGTTLTAGQLNINNATALGSGAFTILGGTIDNTSGGTITLTNSNTQNWNGDFTFTGTGDLNLGTGAVAMNATRTLTVSGGNLTVGGAVSGSTFGLTKNGSGTLILSGANTYNGTTTVNAGTLSLGNLNAIQNSTLDTGSSGSQAVTFTVAGNNTYNIGALQGSDDLAIGGNTISLGANNASTSYSGNISGTGGLTKVGTGTFTLAAASSYSGSTTISAGTLSLGASNVIGDSSAVSIGGGTLAVGGQTEAVSSLSMTSGLVTIGSNGDLTLNTASSLSGGEVRITAGTGKMNTAGLLTLGSVTFNSTHSSASQNNLQLGGDISVSASATANFLNSSSGGPRINLGNANRVFDVGSGANLNLNWGIYSTTASSGAVTKNGSGTMTLNSTTSYTGGTTINNGTFSLGHASDTLADSGAVVISGGTLSLGANNDTVGAITLTSGSISGSGKLTGSSYALQGGNISANLGTGTITVTSGTTTLSGTADSTTIVISSGNLTLGAANRLADTAAVTVNSTFNLGGFNETIAAFSGNSSGAVQLGAGTLTTNSSSNSAFAGAISGTGGLTKEGTGALTLSGVNSFSGTTTINAGSIRLGGAASSDTLTGNITINTGGTLDYSNSNDNQIKDTAVVTIAGGTFDASSRGETIASLTITSGNFTKAGGTFSLGGNLTMSGGNLSMTSSGTIALGAASSFTGGNVSLSNAGARINTTGTTTLGNSSFSYNAAGNANQGIILSGDILVNSSSTANFTNASTGLGRISLGGAARVFDVGSSSNMSVGWIIDATNSSGTLTKNGTGTLTLSAANTYTGSTTVNAGTLTLSGGSAISNTGAVSIAGGTLNLASSETIGSLTGGGNVTLGANTLTVNASSTQSFWGAIAGTGGLSKTGSFAWTLNGTTANTYSGVTSITENILYLAKTDGINAISGNITLGDGIGGDILYLSSGNQIADTSIITMAGTVANARGDFRLNGFNETIGGLSGDGLVQVDASTATINSTLTLNVASGLTLSSNATLRNSNNSGPVLTLVKTGAGTQTLTNTANSYTGSTTINAGTLSVSTLANGGSNSNIGASTNAASNLVLGGGTLEYTGATVSTDRNFTLTNGTTSTISVTNGTTTLTISGAAATGNGSLTKDGAGTLLLSGANAYTGATTIAAGTLTASGGSAVADSSAVSISSGAVFNLGASETVGSVAGAGNVTLGANTLTAGGDNSNTTLSGVISGSSGAVSKAGSGTLVLSGANTYTGATTINAGTLQIGNAGTTGSLSTSSSITNNGTLAFNRTNTVTQGTDFASVISGTGALVQAGSGNLILSGANTYTGATTINAGTLQIGNAGTTGSLSTSSSITNNGTLAFNRTNTITQGTDFASVISGTGALVQAGSGNLILSGANTYTGATTINAGTLQIGNAGTTGSLSTSSSITNNGTLAFNRTNTITQGTDFNSVISGTGAVVQAGSGTLALGGTNTYNGATTINAGTINLTGSIASSATTINNGGILLGTGTTGGLTINSGGRISPGASGAVGNINVSTLTINGGGGYNFNITSATGTPGTNWDLLTVGGGTGAATLNNTAASPFTVYLNGTPTGWSSSGNYSWNIIDWGTATGFSAGNFTVDTTALNVSINGNWTFSNSGGFLNLAYAGVAVSASYWSGGTNVWGAGGGFDTVPVNGYTLDFTGASTATATNNIASASLNSVKDIIFESGAGAFTLAANSGSSGFDAASALAVTGTIQNLSTNTQTINLALSLATSGNEFKASSGNIIVGGAIANAAGFTVSGANNLNLNGNITGAGGITMSGSGLLTLNGSNSYSGTTTVSAGTLRANGGSAIGDSSAVTVGASGNLSLGASETIGSLAGAGAVSLGSNTLTTGGDNSSTTFSGAASGSGGLTKAGTGTFTLNGTNTYTGSTTISAGNLTVSGGSAIADTSAVSVSSGAVFSLASSEAVGSIAGAGNVTLGANTLTAGGDNTSTTFSGLISGSGGLTKNGTGALTLSSANTFSGGATLNAGTLNLGSATAIGNGTFTINGGTIDNTSGAALTLSNNNAQTWNGNFTFLGTKDLNTGTGTITLGANNTVTVSAGNLTLGGQLSGTNKSITKNGTGTLVIAGVNRIGNWVGGSVVLNSGTLQMDAGNNLGTLPNATQLTFNGDSALAFSNTAFVSSIASGRNIVINNGVTATIDAQASSAFPFAIQSVISGGGSLVKTGAGTLILENTNTYTGSTTINSGTLQFGQANAAGTLSASSAITNNGTIYFNRSDTITQGSEFANAIAGTGNLLKGASGNLVLTGNNTYSGSTTITGGTIQITGSGRLGGGNYAGNITITNVGNYLTYNGSNNQVLSGVVSGAGELQKQGSSVLTLSGNNSLTGDLRFDGGTILAGHNNALGSASSGSLVVYWDDSTSKTLAAAGASSFTVGRNLKIYNDLTLGESTTNTGSLNLTGAVDLGSSATRTLTIAANTSHTLGGVVSGSGSAITKAGTGTLTLSGNNTYSGGLTISAGTLVLGHANAAGTGTITQSSGSSLLTFDTTGTISNTMSIYTVSALQSATLSGSITVNNASFDVDSGDTLTISGNVGGTGGVTKNGTGTLVLSGSNTYSGATTINAGTLNASHASALSTNASVTVNGGSLLVSADDAINGKNLTLASTASGNGSAASLVFSGNYNGTAGSLTLNQNSIIDLGEGSVVVHFSDIVWGGSTTLGIYNWTGTTLWGGGTGNNTDQFYIDSALDAGELNRISFYSGIGNSSFVGTAYQLTGGSFANQVIPVPEPETYATAVLLLLGGGLWIWRNRRSQALSEFGTLARKRAKILPPRSFSWGWGAAVVHFFSMNNRPPGRSGWFGK